MIGASSGAVPSGRVSVKFPRNRMSSDDAPIITVLQSKDPRLNPGDQAYVLGSIVADPAGSATHRGDEPHLPDREAL